MKTELFFPKLIGRYPSFYWRICFAVALLIGAALDSFGQSLYFYARPFEAFEGDAVVFTYLPTPPSRSAFPGGRPAGVPLAQVRKWKWDFNGDGTWDEQKEVGINDVTIDQLNATWIATTNAATAVGGINTYTPRLQITTTANVTLPVQVGVTEDVFGLDGGTDATIKIKKRSVANSQIRVNFSANPRLALPGLPNGKVKLLPDVNLLEGVTGTISSYLWSVSGGTFQDGTNSASTSPVVTWPGDGTYDISLTINYTVAGQTMNLTETKKDFVRVQGVPSDLQLGRAYRRGFPETYGWDDIITAYGALGVGNNRYVYFNHLEDAFFTQQSALLSAPTDATQRRVMAEAINELLQGQSLIGNQRLIEALRIKYPRLTTDIDPEQDRLNPPAGVRDETAAIETAILDLHAPIRYAAVAVRNYGTDILRVGAPSGEEPFPQFPQYLSFSDPSLSQAPIPIKNEYWQFGGVFERMALGRMEKAKKLFRLSAQDSSARSEAAEECKVAGIQSYLGMAVLAAAQTEREFQNNEGNLMLAHMKNARDLFETINAGLNPLGNDGSFVPNESFTATFQDAQEAVADAREAEINARQEDRTYDHYQADLRNEQQSQRASFITPLTNLTGVDPVLYNDLKTVDDQNDYRNTIRTRVNALLTSYPNANPAGTGEFGSQVIGVLDSGIAIEQSVNRLTNLARSIEISQWANTQVDIANADATAQLSAHDIARGIANSVSFSTGTTLGVLISALGLSSGTATTAQFTVGVSVSPGSIISGILNADDRDIQRLQSARIADIQLEEQTRKSLLEVANLVLDIRRAKNAYDQQKLRLDQLLSQMDRLIEDLAHARDTASSLYFQDPSFRVVVSQAQRRADAETDFAVDRLYRLAKTLEYEWAEAYQNPGLLSRY